jgi:hypothetical protein
MTPGTRTGRTFADSYPDESVESLSREGIKEVRKAARESRFIIPGDLE